MKARIQREFELEKQLVLKLMYIRQLSVLKLSEDANKSEGRAANSSKYWTNAFSVVRNVL